MLMVKTLRVGMVTVALLAALLTVETASAAALVSCGAQGARVSVLEAKLAKLQQQIDARNAKIADAGNDLDQVAGWEAALTHARQHRARISTRLAAVTKSCSG